MFLETSTLRGRFNLSESDGIDGLAKIKHHSMVGEHPCKLDCFGVLEYDTKFEWLPVVSGRYLK